MFIDYIPLMLINMAAGLVMLASYLYYGLDAADKKAWASGFAIVGAVGAICGYHMTFTWPLPGSYNVAFGETSILFGILFLGASLSLARGWELVSLGIYSLFAGLTAIIVGMRIINLGLTREPLLSGIGFILTGLSGILVLPVLYLRTNKTLRILVAVLLIVAAVIWLRTGYKAYWSHLSDLSKWLPHTMR